MHWPLSQDYNEGVQLPLASFADPELRGGQAVTNALGIPVPRSGNFADVYEFRGASGAHWAVKCFTRHVRGLQERYSGDVSSGKYFHSAIAARFLDHSRLQRAQEFYQSSLRVSVERLVVKKNDHVFLNVTLDRLLPHGERETVLGTGLRCIAV